MKYGQEQFQALVKTRGGGILHLPTSGFLPLIKLLCNSDVCRRRDLIGQNSMTLVDWLVIKPDFCKKIILLKIVLSSS